MKKYDFLIIGSGLFGSVFAHQAHNAGYRCLVIDKRNHTGGNIYCENINDINVHKYGAHIFHTDNKEVWTFVNQFVEFNRFTNSPLAKYKGKLYNLPFNMNTFYQLWGVSTTLEAQAKIEEQRGFYKNIEPKNLEEQALKLCGKDIYQYFIKEYTEKQWGRSATELPPFIIKRIPFRFSFDNNYFNDQYQGIPIGGYNNLIDKLLYGSDVILNTNFFSDRSHFENIAEKILFTGCIDEFFEYKFGKLDYRSLHFKTEKLDIPSFQGNAVVNYNEKSFPFTRIIEHKYFEFGNQLNTVITYEYPIEFKSNEEPYYPINDEKNTLLYKKYQELTFSCKNTLFGGRLAQYSYFDMDDTIEMALALAKQQIK